MEELISEALKFSLAMISVLNPLGAIPIFLSMTKTATKKDIKSIAQNCALTVFITLTISLFIGENILAFFSISISSFKVGGGILIGIMGLSMLKAERAPTKMNDEEATDKNMQKELGVVPLAIPLLSGPGAISSCIIYAEKVQGVAIWGALIFSLLIISFIIFLILLNSRLIKKTLGSIGLNVLTRIMGLILMALAVEFVVSGVKLLFPVLAS
jgi:multiple antibiotic resistance protein